VFHAEIRRCANRSHKEKKKIAYKNPQILTAIYERAATSSGLLTSACLHDAPVETSEQAYL
jgi:hypothetical protein